MNKIPQKWRNILVVILAGLAFVGWRYATADEDRLVAMNANNGRFEWSTPVPRASIFKPVVSNNQIYIILNGEDDETDQLLALSGDTGQVLWQFVPDADLLATDSFNGKFFPLSATADFVALPAGYEQIAILDADTGSVQHIIENIWLPEPYSPAMALTNDTLFILGQGLDPSLRAFDLLSDQQLWVNYLEDPNIFSSCLLKWIQIMPGSDHVYLQDCNNIYAYEIENGNQVMQHEVFSYFYQNYTESTLYQITRDDIVAINLESLSSEWQNPLPQNHNRRLNLQIGLETVFVTTFEGDTLWTLGYDRDMGSVRWQQPIVQPFADTFFIRDEAVVIEDTLYRLWIDEESSEIMALAGTNGSISWQVHLSQLQGGEGLSTNGRSIFIITRAPRWKYWLLPLTQQG
jgi:outer membrane protein assembly factor BamB